jgi:hypothetical protein
MPNVSVSKPLSENIWRFSYDKSHATQIQDKKFGFEKQDPCSSYVAKFHAAAYLINK